MSLVLCSPSFDFPGFSMGKRYRIKRVIPLGRNFSLPPVCSGENRERGTIIADSCI